MFVERNGLVQGKVSFYACCCGCVDVYIFGETTKGCNEGDLCREMKRARERERERERE